MKLLNLSVLMACAALLATSNVVAQDYTTKTLSFDNITNTNVNQDNEPSSTNEKEIDFADMDMDGDLDVVMAVARSDFGQRRNKLYRNDNGVLTEVTASVIPAFLATDTSRCAFFEDFTGDGYPDIIIVNDSNSGTSQNTSPGKTKFYRNINGTSFVNESGRLDNITGAACNGSVADFDNNGMLDLMMVNYPNTTQDSLALNGINGLDQGDFDNVTGNISGGNMPREASASQGGFGQYYGVHGESADMNGDGKVDILITNRTNQPSYIYYNNLNGQGSGDGDFRYGSSTGGVDGVYTVPDTSGGVLENAMIPGDFNNDGLMDFYYANAGASGASTADEIYINTGNDANNMAQFDQVRIQNPNGDVITALNDETYKVTCSDLDGDGRTDVVIMSEDRRPYILRNTTENGEVSFIEWTPSIFTTTHEGWQANMADITGNGREDILVGAMNDDFLFENTPSVVTDFDTLSGGILPTFVNSAPIAISGTIEAGETLVFIGSGIPTGADISMLTRSANADLSIDVSVNGTNVVSSDRAGEDVDEAVSFSHNSTGTILIEVTNNSSGVLLGDVNMDGVVNLLDVGPFVDSIGGAYIAEADMNQDGVVNLLDVSPFVDALSNGGTNGGSAEFVAEFLGRTN